MAAIGDIFRLAGGLCFMSSQLIILQWPSTTFSSISFQQASIASLLFADVHGPESMAA